MAAEPSRQRKVLLRYFVATRPAFLSVTFCAVLLGLATASSSAPLDLTKAIVTLLFALCAHAGVNVLNDYYDALNGSDAANSERLFPFTGGSRTIQNGVLSAKSMAIFGYTLLALVIPAGLWLTAVSTPTLLLIGLAGLLLGWAYSAPPLQLMCRGLGEIAIATCWWLVVVGSDLVQRGNLDSLSMVAGLSYALLVVNVLYINQFPDRVADAAAGKRTLVIRLGPGAARWGHALIGLCAHGWLLLSIVAGWLPAVAALALLTLIPTQIASLALLRHATTPARLVPAIVLTILAANLHGIVLAATIAKL